MSKKTTKPNIKSLPLQKFLSLTPNRLAKIKNAPETPVRQLEDYNANAMAMALHPAKQFLVISQIIDHKNGFKSFVFEPDLEKGTKNLAFASAGQYINFKFPIGTSLVSRPYSFSSSPKQSEEGKYMISIKKMPEGFSSNYIFDNWTVGTKVEASAPLDLMTYEPLRDAPVVIGVAGGSGITPFYSMAQAIKDGYEDFDLILLYGTRTLEDGIFLEEMKEIEKTCPRFKLINILSEEKIEEASKNELSAKLNLTLEEGFITADLIKKYGSFDNLRDNGYDVDSPESFQLDVLKNDLELLAQGVDIYAPEYLPNGTGVSVPKSKFVQANKIIIVEGMATMYKDIKDIFDIKVYVETDNEIRKERFLHRAFTERNQDFANAKKHWQYIIYIYIVFSS